MVNKVKVAIAGINGKMGRASAQGLCADAQIEFVGAFGRKGAAYAGKPLADVIPIPGYQGKVVISDDIAACLSQERPDVVLDFSIAESAVEHAQYALKHGVRPVIGASGVQPDHVNALRSVAAERKIGAMIVPNFSVGAVLMMEFAQLAAKHFSNVEIVEMHHTKKLDAPSGTAMHTARKISELEKSYNPREVDDKELLTGARGGVLGSGVRVHSLRLPGLISHQDVIFGSDGELLTIRHDSFNTNCFLKGIKLSIVSVMQMDGLVVGLESLL